VDPWPNPGWGRTFFLLKNVQIGWLWSPANLQLNEILDFFSGGKAAGV
jgi:hypothetical protein